MLTPVIGLSGYKQSGKDEIFRALADYYDDVRRIAFADPLKQELAHACGVTVPFVEENKSVFRLGLQWWGTEFRRELHGKHYWIDKSRTEYLRVCKTGPSLVVFTDCRFPNEADLIRELGGKMWRVERPAPGKSFLQKLINRRNKSLDRHSSETALDDHGFDRIIYNDGTLPQLHGRAISAFEEDFR